VGGQNFGEAHGIIYVVGDKLWIDATPVARAANFSDFAIHERDHNQS
jgi:hypothetical protein